MLRGLFDFLEHPTSRISQTFSQFLNEIEFSNGAVSGIHDDAQQVVRTEVAEARNNRLDRASDFFPYPYEIIFATRADDLQVQTNAASARSKGCDGEGEAFVYVLGPERKLHFKRWASMVRIDDEVDGFVNILLSPGFCPAMRNVQFVQSTTDGFFKNESSLEVGQCKPPLPR